jgi:5-methyltetrahydrofolate--homocysteine methyltransferase
MEKVAGQTKGKIVLATVKGDVHDIGKNLVDIILTNNGYTVYNLGIKQPINDIIKAAQEHNADAIGMSGLLVKSVGVMKDNLEEMNLRGVKAPVLLGGAALNRDYATSELATLYQGKLFYCNDAFEGLATMDKVVGGQLDVHFERQQAESRRRRDLKERAVKPAPVAPGAGRSDVAMDNAVPLPPFWGRRIITGLPLDEVFAFINPNALFQGQWGFKKKGLSDAQFERSMEESARPTFERLKERAVVEKLLDPKVAYGYFPVQSRGDEVIVYHVEEFAGCTCGGPHGGSARPSAPPREWMRFAFPRQEGRRRLCIADFFRSVESGEYDVLGAQLVTVGDRASQIAQELFAQNKYQEYLYLHGFGVESAEGLAEMWHKRMRQELGFGTEDSPRISELFQQSYRGSRYSFGYAACPNLEDRAKIVQLLRPESIGVALSENFMLVPEQSTDALIVHHPRAKYFDA